MLRFRLNFFSILSCLWVLFFSCAQSNESTSFNFLPQKIPFCINPLYWLWHHEGGVDSLKKEFKLNNNSTFFLAYKYSEIGDFRHFEEALLDVAQGENSYITQLASQNLMNYWITNRLFKQIEKYGLLWKDRFQEQDFKKILARAFYWSGKNQESWDIFENLIKSYNYDLTEEEQLFRAVLALRLNLDKKEEFLRNFIRDLPSSDLHKRYADYIEASPKEASRISLEAKEWLFLKRSIYLRDTGALRNFLNLLKFPNSDQWFFSYGLSTDLASLSNSSKEIKQAIFFLEEQWSNNPSEYLAFSKALLWEKLEDWRQAVKNYKDSFGIVTKLKGNYKDFYFFHYLKSFTKISVQDFINQFGSIPKSFFKTSQFLQLFDSFLSGLFEVRNWQGIYDLYLGANHVLSPTYQSHIAFLLARLIEKGFLSIASNSQKKKNDFYEIAMKVEPLSYGSLMAHYFRGKDIKDIFLLKSKVSDNWQTDENVDKVLQGFIQAGLSKKAYQFLIENEEKISRHRYTELAQLMAYKEEWFNSVGVMSRLAKRVSWHLTQEEIRVFYPKAYWDTIRYWSLHYGLNPFVRLGQIHDESRFDSYVTSGRKAIGISQLLKTTAQDIALELNVHSYDIRNPDDNIRFGSYYLSKFFSRNNFGFKALIAYNAGETRLREWDMILRDLPDEFYVESIPFAETRRYVRSVLLNAAIYCALYGKSEDFNLKIIPYLFSYGRQK